MPWQQTGDILKRMAWQLTKRLTDSHGPVWATGPSAVVTTHYHHHVPGPELGIAPCLDQTPPRVPAEALSGLSHAFRDQDLTSPSPSVTHSGLSFLFLDFNKEIVPLSYSDGPPLKAVHHVNGSVYRCEPLRGQQSAALPSQLVAHY